VRTFEDRNEEGSGLVKRLCKLAAIVLINMAVLFSLLVVINLIAAVALDTRLLGISREVDSRVNLPNYTDKVSARSIFAEFNTLATQYKPYVGWTRKEFHGITTTIDGEGDRQHRQNFNSSVATIRFFGGSTIWGTGVDDEGTIPAEFNRLFPRHQVFNHGETAFISRQNLARLINLINHGASLDLVIFYGGVNDVLYQCYPGSRLDGHSRERVIAERTDTPRVLQLLFGYTKESVLRKASAIAGVDAYTSSRCQEDLSHARRVAEALIQNWKMAHELVTARGGRFVAVLQPVAYLGSPKREHLDLPLTSARARDYLTVYPLIKKRIAELHVDWIFELTNALDGTEFFYIDFCHVSKNGNEVIAKKLATLVEGQLRSGSDKNQ